MKGGIVIQDDDVAQIADLIKAYANEHRDWRVFAEVAAVLIRLARWLYPGSPFELGLEADLVISRSFHCSLPV